ncbi:uncharacterized protein LOC132056814 isoform X2 [Lycium ferocissimum]|uniref:uncharacterized protein LOC132056814 isoform X2 n=1 Tax=Lycium ferocissimum TaxID=112874 RepID=UPI002814B41F|nr:uncharacterized protein LOC132056814 isoform X2 [Lycium ferocissimum]
MAPGGRVYKQKTLTGETISVTQSDDESNKHTPATTTDDTTRIKKGRGKTRGKGLEKLKSSLGKKMVIEIPVGKGRPVEAVQSAKLSNELGIIARNFLTLPNKWKELTVEEKDAALIRCHEKFEINLDEHYVKDSCEDILKNRSRQWRYKLKKKFESANSVEDARKIEVPELTPENWNTLCDMWSSPEHKKRCQVNKVNRSKLKYNHFMGSKAFVAARAEIGKTNEGVEPDRIEFYKDTHYSSEKGWSSQEAKDNYNDMNDLKALYSEGDSTMTIDEIMDVVLGKKSGYLKGLGYGPKPNTARATQRRTAELEDSLRKAKEEAASAQDDLQKRLNAAEVVVENQQTQIQDQQSQIQSLNSQLNTLLARQDDISKQLQRFMSSSRSSDH